MYYTNTMKVTLKNKKIAAAALEIMKTCLAVGFDCDKKYKRNPSMEMIDNLKITGKKVILPEDFGCYLPEDAEIVIPELLRDLAEHLSNETFTCENSNTTDDDESWVEAQYVDGALTVKTTYFPSGYCDFYCEECDEVVISMDDYEEGETYTCPECGEEMDLSDWAPVITENTIQIV